MAEFVAACQLQGYPAMKTSFAGAVVIIERGIVYALEIIGYKYFEGFAAELIGTMAREGMV